jgi:hypothetical protein
MNPPEEAIDKALQSLAQAPVPDGMESRILRRIEAHNATQTKHRPAARWLVPVGAICAACLVLAIVVLPRRAPLPPQLAPPVAPSATQAVLQPTSLMPVSAQRRPKHTPHTQPHLLPTQISFPAPPAPLTEQEKLLIQYARTRHAQSMSRNQIARNPSPPTPPPAAAQAPLTHEETLLVAASRIHQPGILDALDERRRAEIDTQQRQDFAAYAAQKDGGS